MLILLDIDGVMVPANSWKRPEFLDDGFSAFSLKSINALKKIISETDAHIILTTSHKSSYDIPQWLKIFKLRGIDLNIIDRLTDNYSNLNRKQEILDWYNSKQHLHEHFVILDDDKSLNALPSHLKEHLVLTSSLVGLTDELADNAISILKNDALAYA
jgi:hypothetical protein